MDDGHAPSKHAFGGITGWCMQMPGYRYIYIYHYTAHNNYVIYNTTSDTCTAHAEGHGMPAPECALPPSALGTSARTVAFIGTRFHSFESYVEGSGYLGGEAYWAACVAYALRQLRINVSFHNSLQIGPNESSQLYHRVIMDGFPDAQFLKAALNPLPAQNNGDAKSAMLCRLRVFHFWGHWQPAAKLKNLLLQMAPQPTIDERSVLVPYMSSMNAPVPIFPLSVATLPPSTNATRRRAVFVIGKRCSYEVLGAPGMSTLRRLCVCVFDFHPHARTNDLTSRCLALVLLACYFLTPFIMREQYLPKQHISCWRAGAEYTGKMYLALHRANFEIHTTNACAPARGVRVKVVAHGILSPVRFALLLREMACVIGMGFPPDAPTPLEALANGAAFLNPILTMRDQATVATRKATTLEQQEMISQHRALQSLGAPYVYNFDPRNYSALVASAERAMRHRFASYIPLSHRLETTISAVCANMIQHDALCQCATSNEGCEGSLLQTF